MAVNIDAPLAGLQRKAFIHNMVLELDTGVLDEADVSKYATAIQTYFGATPDRNYADGIEISSKTIREAGEAISEGDFITKGLFEGAMFRAYHKALERPVAHAVAAVSKRVDYFTSPAPRR